MTDPHEVKPQTPGVADHAAPRKVYAFDASAMKAHIGALLAFFTVLSAFVAAEEGWPGWWPFIGALLAGAVSALAVYHTGNKTS